METITIPSPSVFLAKSPVLRTISSPVRSPQPNQRRRSQGTKATPATTTTTSSQKQRQRQRTNVACKPKQSKSRNGCVTCKAKRLKCDETKPSCQQCHKRSVPCGGYKREFKWRNFEETSLNNKIVPPPKPRRNTVPSTEPREPSQAISPTTSDASLNPPEIEVDPELPSNEDRYPKIEDVQDYYDLLPENLLSDATFEPSLSSSIPNFFEIPFRMEETYRPRTTFSEPSSATEAMRSTFGDLSFNPFLAHQSSSGLSPKFHDIHLSRSDLDTIPPDFDMLQDLKAFDEQHDDPDDLGKIQNVQRLPQFPNDESWATEHFPRNLPNAGFRNCPFPSIYRQLEVQADSPEMLMLKFDKQTCGILSIKDGPSENPWRTLIWPLARDSPALYHAIAAMTAFHTSKGQHTLRLNGMEHMRRSIRLLSHNLSSMRPDTALATTLALAFSESWDQHISTGIKHLRGAKILVNQALTQHNRRSLASEDLARLKFLCNTFTYMDVIARLTSVDADESNDFESLISPSPTPFGSMSGSTEIDPLMGCASTLFPLIGRAANLCRRARHSESNSIAIISQAMELKEQMEQWESGTSFEKPEDPSSEVQHALQTAEAYRYATLLYLHQAVPEIPSLTSAQLAQKVLVYLATVPRSSRLIIVQIYPLLAAGCEVTEAGDRQWVRERWQNMSDRMWIGNIDRCCEVMMEVWERRDAFVAQKEAARRGKENQRRSIGGMGHLDISKEMSEAFSFQDMLSGHSSLGGALKRESHLGRSLRMEGESRMGGSSLQRGRNSEPITENLEVEYTVRGQLHWVGVMKDWHWEVLLG